jgi:hypothetical protein
VECFYEYGDEPSVSVKGVDVFDQLSDYQFSGRTLLCGAL